jgi:hypothetical protein
MAESEKGGRAFSIERRQSLRVETDGHTHETSEVFVKVYRGIAMSGLLADLSGNELKVLLALGLEAKVLGGDPEAERHFERLKSYDVVTSADRGRLFCYLDRDTIAERTGLSTRTVSTAGKALVDKQLIEKRSVRNHSGQHDYNVYFVRAASHLGKFDFNRRSFQSTQESELHRGKNLPTVDTMGKEPPAVGFPYVKKGSSSGSSGKRMASQVLAPDSSKQLPGSSRPAGWPEVPVLDTMVFARFAERQGAGDYEPTEQDVCGLAQARGEGYTQDRILAAIDEAFVSRKAGSEPIRRFTYCLPILRSRESSSQQPQPVPSGSPVVTQQTDEGSRNEAPTKSAPTVASLTSDGVEAETDPLADAMVADEWEAAMERVYQKVRKAGWPISETLQTALRAKAVRVDDVARQQEADGPGWAGDAMLLALGRKMGKNGRQNPTDEELLAYADGILANWAQKGRARVRRETQRGSTSARRAVSASEEWQAEPSESHLASRKPKSEEEELWEQILDELQLQMTQATFDQWLRGSELLELHQPEAGVAQLVVQVGSHHAVDWLEHRLKRVIRRTVERRLGQEADLTFQTRKRTHAREEDE